MACYGDSFTFLLTVYIYSVIWFGKILKGITFKRSFIEIFVACKTVEPVTFSDKQCATGCCNIILCFILFEYEIEDLPRNIFLYLFPFQELGIKWLPYISN
jgi:hypothetical protein